MARDCPLLITAKLFQISTAAVALAASYFQRIACSPRASHACALTPEARAARKMDMMIDINTRPDIMEYMTLGGSFRARLELPKAVRIYVACLHVAVKVVSYPRNCPKALGGGYSFHNVLLCLTGARISNRELWGLEGAILRRLGHRVVPLMIPSSKHEHELSSPSRSTLSTNSSHSEMSSDECTVMSP